MTAFVLTPYETSKILEGVIPANRTKRPNFLQNLGWGPYTTRETTTVNFDAEFATKNVATQYVSPNVDAPLVQLGGFGHQELRFAYLKEGLVGASIDELDHRQIGQPIGSVNWMQNYIQDMQKKLAISEANFETRFEVTAASIMLNGGYTVSSQYHPTMTYDFNRTVVTTDAGYVAGYVPEIDLTTLNGNGGVGKRAWGSTGGTAGPTPYIDFVKACGTTLRRTSIEGVIMSNDAFDLLQADITANYLQAADLTMAVQNRIELQVLPMVENFQDVTYRGSYKVSNGSTVNVYTYTAVVADRTTGVDAALIPDGYMLVVPSKTSGIKIYGRIHHLRANYAAMPRYINMWEDPKTGAVSSEIHSNYLMGHIDIDSLVCWKVM